MKMFPTIISEVLARTPTYKYPSLYINNNSLPSENDSIIALSHSPGEIVPSIRCGFPCGTSIVNCSMRGVEVAVGIAGREVLDVIGIVGLLFSWHPLERKSISGGKMMENIRLNIFDFLKCESCTPISLATACSRFRCSKGR